MAWKTSHLYYKNSNSPTPAMVSWKQLNASNVRSCHYSTVFGPNVERSSFLAKDERYACIDMCKHSNQSNVFPIRQWVN